VGSAVGTAVGSVVGAAVGIGVGTGVGSGDGSYIAKNLLMKFQKLSHQLFQLKKGGSAVGLGLSVVEVTLLDKSTLLSPPVAFSVTKGDNDSLESVAFDFP
jgi:hypothetical protein